MDHHVSSAVTDGLRKRGVDVLTAHDDGAAQFDDDTLLNRATELGRVLFSQDRDLLAIAHGRLESGVEFAGLIYAHQLNITVGRAIRDLEMLATVLDPDDLRNRVEFIPL
ncbi:MAG: DUF5615 family PIN-like protein [Anaerolineae bacterium]